ncbi:MAG: Signal peptidase I (EC [uncultured Thiotrichaceae bacterium]|uniref:Signal peptidase I n=1 Tax=uncultured Thiotrichaceae bacterium TaxID=298394 RepID=A0A6S6S8R2_9GAMM|nr:MAG: Signal peptidase I (EC [uncultured Thiotrichaceae bacterium]
MTEAHIAKKRYGVLALLMSLFSPGLGFLYSGAWWLAITIPLLMILLVVGFALSEWIFAPYGILGLLASLFLIYVSSSVLAFFSARKRSPSRIHFFQHWVVYLFFIISFFSIQLIFKELRPSWLGYEAFRLPSRSMAPSLIPNDFVVADTEAYENDLPKRGDIIVFSRPDKVGVKFTKRVIAIEGDTLKIQRGQILVNQKAVFEPYVKAQYNQRSGLLSIEAIKVPKGTVYVLGDNRDNSFDSRYFGVVKAHWLYGRVRALWFSYDKKRGFIRWKRLQRF